MNLFDFTTGIKSLGCKPRSASMEERNAYLRWLAQRDGVTIPANAVFGDDGIRAAGELIVAMPGYGVQPHVVCEILDDSGEVVSRMVLPDTGKGKLPMTAKQVQEWSGLKPVKAKRSKAGRINNPAPASNQGQPTAPLPDVDPIRALQERLARVEAALATLSAETRTTQEVPAHEKPIADLKPRRSAAHERAIRRAWSERREARRQRAGVTAFRQMLEVEEAAVHQLKAELASMRDKRRRAVTNARRHWQGRVMGRIQRAQLEREARHERDARHMAVATARALILKARAQRDTQAWHAKTVQVTLAQLRRNMADPHQPERPSDLNQLRRERDEARNANAALQQRSERAERAAHELAERFEGMVSRISRAEAALRSMQGEAA